MGWASTVPAAVNALYDTLRASPGLAGVEVRDGPTVTESGAQEAVTIGYTDDATEAVDGTLTMEGFAVEPDRETYTINCSASVLNGSGDITAARARAYDLLAAVGAVLVADKTLGGVVMTARVSSQTLRQTQGPNGAQADVMFGVEIDAFTQR